MSAGAANAATAVPDTADSKRIVIRQGTLPLAKPVPAVAKREAVPEARMHTVLRCREGVCTSVSTKTRVGATAPTTD